MRARVRIRVVVVVFVLAGGSAALAQNLVPNPEFDSLVDLSPWSTNSTGTWSVGPDATGCLLSSSAAGTSAPSGGGSQFLNMVSDCFEVSGATTPTLWLSELYQSTAQVFARLTLQFFTDTACATPLTFSATVAAGNSATWRRLLGSVDVPPSTASARLFVDFNPQVAGVPQYTGSVDQVYVGTTALLFADGLETEGGSACRWSEKQGVAP